MERPGEVGRLCPLRAQAGKQQQGAGHQRTERGEVARMRGPHDRADAGVLPFSKGFLCAEPGDFRRDTLAEAAPLQVGLVGVAGLDEHEHAAAVLPGRVHEGSERAEAQERVDGQRRARVPPGQPPLRVRGGGGPDVAPLAVQNDRQAQGARGGAQVFQQVHSAQAQRLVKGELRLDAGGVGSGGLQHVQRVLFQVVGVAVGVQARVEAHAQPGAAGKGALGDGLGEGKRHRGPVYRVIRAGEAGLHCGA